MSISSCRSVTSRSSITCVVVGAVLVLDVDDVLAFDDDDAG